MRAYNLFALSIFLFGCAGGQTDFDKNYDYGLNDGDSKTMSNRNIVGVVNDSGVEADSTVAIDDEDAGVEDSGVVAKNKASSPNPSLECLDYDKDGICDSIDPCPLDPENDQDRDGVCEYWDPCPLDKNDDTDQDGICDSDDLCPGQDDLLNTDGDDVPDCLESCPTDANKIVPGICGCGTSDIDSDHDGTPDCKDGCAINAEKIAAGVCGCAVPDTDTDGDGAADCIDFCGLDPNKITAGFCGCGVVDEDLNMNGIADCLENNCINGNCSLEAFMQENDCNISSFNNHLYTFCNKFQTIFNAQLECEKINGYVVKVDSQEEDDFLFGRRDYYFNITGITGYMLGATDIEIEGRWLWISDGSPAIYTQWASGQPDNSTGVLESGEDCVGMMVGSNTWNDIHCTHEAAYICEVE